jgi:hypothetical protein
MSGSSSQRDTVSHYSSSCCTAWHVKRQLVAHRKSRDVYMCTYIRRPCCCAGHLSPSIGLTERVLVVPLPVLACRYRAVDCGHQPSKKAYGASFPGEGGSGSAGGT